MEQMNEIILNLKKYRISIFNLIKIIELFDIEIEQHTKEKKEKQIFHIEKILGKKRNNPFNYNKTIYKDKSEISKNILKIREKFNKLIKKDEELKKIPSCQKTLTTINSTISFNKMSFISEIDENEK